MGSAKTSRAAPLPGKPAASTQESLAKYGISDKYCCTQARWRARAQALNRPLLRGAPVRDQLSFFRAHSFFDRPVFRKEIRSRTVSENDTANPTTYPSIAGRSSHTRASSRRARRPRNSPCRNLYSRTAAPRSRDSVGRPGIRRRHARSQCPPARHLGRPRRFRSRTRPTSTQRPALALRAQCQQDCPGSLREYYLVWALARPAGLSQTTASSEGCDEAGRIPSGPAQASGGIRTGVWNLAILRAQFL